jgi:hypothetical protein
MIAPGDAELLRTTASMLERAWTRIKAQTAPARIKAASRPAPRPGPSIAELVRRWDADVFPGGGRFDRDAWEDIERAKTAGKNRQLEQRSQQAQEQRRAQVGRDEPEPEKPWWR